MSTAIRNDRVFSLEQAVGAEPTLAMLQRRVRASRDCLDMVRHLIPAPLHKQLVAGPLNNGEWCLLVASSAASTKLRQLLPAIQKHLAEQGAEVTSVRLKVQTPGR
jgi:hypothetical protein